MLAVCAECWHYIVANAKAAKPHGCWNPGIEPCLAPEAEVRKGDPCEALTRQWTTPRLAFYECQCMSCICNMPSTHALCKQQSRRVTGCVLACLNTYAHHQHLLCISDRCGSKIQRRGTPVAKRLKSLSRAARWRKKIFPAWSIANWTSPPCHAKRPHNLQAPTAAVRRVTTWSHCGTL